MLEIQTPSGTFKQSFWVGAKKLDWPALVPEGKHTWVQYELPWISLNPERGKTGARLSSRKKVWRCLDDPDEKPEGRAVFETTLFIRGIEVTSRYRVRPPEKKDQQWKKIFFFNKILNGNFDDNFLVDNGELSQWTLIRLPEERWITGRYLIESTSPLFVKEVDGLRVLPYFIPAPARVIEDYRNLRGTEFHPTGGASRKG